MNEEELVRLHLITTNMRLLESRKQKGYTQIELSKLAGIPISRFQAIENLRCVPTNNEIDNIVGVLGRPGDYLFPEYLLNAVRNDVFAKREVKLREPEIVYLSEVSQKLLPSYNPEDDLIEEADNDVLRNRLPRILGTLTPRQQKVIELRFGLDGQDEHTYKELGKEFGVTIERVRQIEARALRELRYRKRSKLLKPFLD